MALIRHMYDAIHANTDAIRQFSPGLVAGYDTGTSIIKWTPADFASFPNAIHVHIDQGGPGAPVFSAMVQDVEPGAWSPSDVPNWTSNCTWERPTVYCDQSDLSAVLARWGGDVWLAAPGNSDAEATSLAASLSGQIIAVQNVFGGSFDSSILLDDFWPFLPPVHTPPPPQEAEMLNGFVEPGQRVSIPFPAGSFDHVMLYHSIDGDTANVTCTFLSAGGNSVASVGVTDNGVGGMGFPHASTTTCVTLGNGGDVRVGWTLVKLA